MTAVWHAGDACIATDAQPALVHAFAIDRELDERTVLAGTALCTWQQARERGAISPQQYLRMLANVGAALNSPDTSFLLGQQMLPGHFGALSHGLLQASCLREAIAILVRYPVPLCPMLTPRLVEEQGIAAIYWTESFGSGNARRLIVEMEMTALAGMVRWLSGELFPWHYCFNRTRPRYTEQYEVHLGQRLRFDCHLDALVIDAQWLDRPWPRAIAGRRHLTWQGIDPLLEKRALLSALYDYLHAHIRCSPALEQAAAALDVSSATLKRQLARHGSHFQAELDQVRSHVALQLMRRGYDNDAVARYLGFHDASNFRRSCKRWTGVTPMLLRAALTLS